MRGGGIQPHILPVGRKIFNPRRSSSNGQSRTQSTRNRYPFANPTKQFGQANRPNLTSQLSLLLPRLTPPPCNMKPLPWSSAGSDAADDGNENDRR